jgi:hypothetical protein
MQGPPRSSDRRPTDRPPSRARGSEHPRDPRGSSSRPSEHRRTEQRHSRPSEGRSSRPSEGGSRRPSSDEQNTRRPPSNHVGDERPNVERRGDPRPQYLPNGPDPRRSAPRSAPSSGEQVSRRRASAERGVAKRRSSSLPVEVREQDHELDCDFPEGGRPMRRQMSAPAGDMIPLIRSSLRVATQFLSLKTKGLTQDLTQHKRVEFAFLEVREYPIVIGDNPSVKEGPPITIDWAHDPSTQFVLDVNTFEHMRGTRRISSQLVLPKEIREKWYAHLTLFTTI